MSYPGQTLKALLERPSPDLAEIAALLDSLSLADRIAAVRELNGTKLQGALWKAAAAAPPVTVDEMVPPDYPRQRAVIFHGKNSLPAFTDFEKICFRPADADAGNVAWGYNETRIRPVIGPGYYVLHDTTGNRLGGAAFDYTQVPPRGLPSWPPVKANDTGVTQFIYGNMIDYMRRVSSDVFIGSAVKGSKEMGSYFVVVRELLSL